MVATENDVAGPRRPIRSRRLDRADGTLRYFEINAGGKGTGGSFVSADEKHFYVHTRDKGTRAFHLDNGVKTAFMPNEPVLAWRHASIRRNTNDDKHGDPRLCDRIRKWPGRSKPMAAAI